VKSKFLFKSFLEGSTTKNLSNSRWSSNKVKNKRPIKVFLLREITASVERKWLWAFPQIEGVPPTPRGGHSATLTGASLVIFGGHFYNGKDTGFTYLNDTHVLDVNSSRWIKPKISGTPPAPRYGHTAVLAGSRIIIFGGKGSKGHVFRDLHALDPVTMTWY